MHKPANIYCQNVFSIQFYIVMINCHLKIHKCAFAECMETFSESMKNIFHYCEMDVQQFSFVSKSCLFLYSVNSFC